MDDREVVAAIAAGDPAGIAVAYDRYAAGLYGYCHWMLPQPADAAEAVRETFVVAATLGDLPEAPKLRPWLYAVARNECLRRPGTPGAPGEQADVPDHAAIPAGQPADEAGQPAEVSDPEQAELQRQVQAVLAELEPDEREVIELSLRHDLYDSDLATALGVSWSQAYALTSRARGHLEKDLGVLLIAHTGRKDCPALGALLADWDGQLTGQTRELVSEHIEQCGTCAGHRRSAVRPAALSGLLADLQPLAVPPAGLRDEVMKLCSPTTPETPMYRRSAEHVRPTSFSEAMTAMRWGSIRSNPGTAIAAMAVVLWLVAVVSVLLLTLTGPHSAQALPAEPSVSTPATSPAAATTQAPVPAATRASASARPSPTASLRSADPGLAAGRSAPPPGSAAQSRASKSPSPKPSKSSSPTPSASATPTPSPSPSTSSSPTPSPTPSSSPSPSASKSA